MRVLTAINSLKLHIKSGLLGRGHKCTWHSQKLKIAAVQKKKEENKSTIWPALPRKSAPQGLRKKKKSAWDPVGYAWTVIPSICHLWFSREKPTGFQLVTSQTTLDGFPKKRFFLYKTFPLKFWQDVRKGRGFSPKRGKAINLTLVIIETSTSETKKKRRNKHFKGVSCRNGPSLWFFFSFYRLYKKERGFFHQALFKRNNVSPNKKRSIFCVELRIRNSSLFMWIENLHITCVIKKKE